MRPLADEKVRLDMRRRLLEAVRRFPGLHLRELARQLDTSVALVSYHLENLLEAGLVRVEAEERYQRVFAVGDDWALRPEDRRWLAALRQPKALHVALHMLDVRGPVRHGDLVEALGIGKSTLTFHLKKLQAVGIVEKTPSQQFVLTDARRLERLLLEHEPTPDLLGRFERLWLSLYGED